MPLHMTIRAIISFLALLTVVTTCLAQKPGAPATESTRLDLKPLVQGGGQFATDIYAKLAEKPGNMFLSPSSIRTALAMTYAGAAGQTAKQMAATLHLPSDGPGLHAAFAELIAQLNGPPELRDQPAYQLVVANALWGQKGYPFKQTFTDLVKKYYGAGLNDVDFNKPSDARKTINDWVASQTKDKIKDLIPSDDLVARAMLVLTNAIYFKSNWAEQFAKKATKDEPFKVAADKSVDVPMMHQVHEFEYFEDADLQVLLMPYQMDRLSMAMLLPRKADGLGELEKNLSAANLDKWLEAAKEVKVNVSMPKFKVTSQFDLSKTLVAMGMIDAFSIADFSGMTDAEKLVISAVLHKAFVAVDEEGTEAATATAVVLGRGAMPIAQEPKVFKADHPFIFLIRHNETGEILFMGRLVEPKD